MKKRDVTSIIITVMTIIMIMITKTMLMTMVVSSLLL